MYILIINLIWIDEKNVDDQLEESIPRNEKK